MTDEKRILLINDLSGCGKVALSAMIPILSTMGYHVSNLPTAIVSNTLDYGQFQILDTTEYMNATVDIWNRLDFHFSCISMGFLCQMRQVEVIKRLINNNPDAYVCVDPIMGDDGHLYNGISVEIVEQMRKLVEIADLVIPNLTEAELLVYGEVNKTEYTEEYCISLLNNLRKMGAKTVVITSILLDGNHYIYGMEGDDIFQVQYQYIDARFPGTGDVFSSVLLGNLLKGITLKDGCQRASDFVYHTMRENLSYEDHNQGLRIENSLKNLNGGLL